MNVYVVPDGRQVMPYKHKPVDPVLVAAAQEEGIQVGCDEVVEIDKVYGPLIFWPVRVRAEFETCEWVVERLFGNNEEWRTVARIAGQMESDFDEEPERG